MIQAIVVLRWPGSNGVLAPGLRGVLGPAGPASLPGPAPLSRRELMSEG